MRNAVGERRNMNNRQLLRRLGRERFMYHFGHDMWRWLVDGNEGLLTEETSFSRNTDIHNTLVYS